MKKFQKWGALLLGLYAWVMVSMVHELPWLVGLDAMGNQWFRFDFSEGVTELIFRGSQIGSITVLIGSAGAIALILLCYGKLGDFLWFGVSVATTAGLAPIIFKYLLRRPRPVDGLMLRSGYSFPSGHAIGTLALYGTVIVLAQIYVRNTGARKLIIGISMVIMLFTAWSRVYLGVHFFSDILASWSLGGGLLVLFYPVRGFFKAMEARLGESRAGYKIVE